MYFLVIFSIFFLCVLISEFILSVHFVGSLVFLSAVCRHLSKVLDIAAGGQPVGVGDRPDCTMQSPANAWLRPALL